MALCKEVQTKHDDLEAKYFALGQEKTQCDKDIHFLRNKEGSFNKAHSDLL